MNDDYPTNGSRGGVKERGQFDRERERGRGGRSDYDRDYRRRWDDRDDRRSRKTDEFPRMDHRSRLTDDRDHRRADRGERVGGVRDSNRFSQGHDDRGPRKRSRSPPPKRREPTPDLSNVVPINERKRRHSLWDVKPKGYENVSADQAKLSGLFPLPGAPRQSEIDPARLSAFMAQPGVAAPVTNLKPAFSRQARRVIVSKFPENSDESALARLFNDTIQPLNVGSTTVPPVISARLSGDKSFAMVEYRSSAESTLAVALNGMQYGDRKLKIRRPKDYVTPHVADEVDESFDGNRNEHVEDSPHKIMATELPVHLTDEQALELFSAFGEMRAFTLVKDTTTGDSQGIAFLEYVDRSVTDAACEGLDNMDLAGQHIHVVRACRGITQKENAEAKGTDALVAFAEASDESAAGRVLQLLNMVSSDELQADDEYQDIRDDVLSECSKLGTVVDVKIPRPLGNKSSNGVGKVFIRFETTSASIKALHSLSGRRYNDRTILAAYFPEESYEVEAW